MYFQKSNNKKGNAILDTVTIMIIVLVFGTISVIGYVFLGDMNDDFQAEAQYNASKTVAQNTTNQYPSLMDNLLLTIYVLFVLFTVVAVILLDTHPVFFIFTVIMIASVLVVALLLGNFFDDLMTDEVLSASANSFPYTSWLLRHFVEVTVAHAFLLGTALFVKFRG